LSALDSRETLHEPSSASNFIRSPGNLICSGRLVDRSRYKEDGVMWPLKAKCLNCICSDCFTPEILDSGPLSLGHSLLRPWSLMGWEGVSNQRIGSGSVEAALYPVLVL